MGGGLSGRAARQHALYTAPFTEIVSAHQRLLRVNQSLELRLQKMRSEGLARRNNGTEDDAMQDVGGDSQYDSTEIEHLKRKVMRLQEELTKV